MGWNPNAKKAEIENREKVSTKDLFKKKEVGPRHLKVGIASNEGLGKSHMACTFPDPIYVLDTEFGMWPIANKFDKDIRIANCPVLGDKDTPDAIASLNKFEEAVKRIPNDANTIVVDSMSDIWTWIRGWLEHVADRKTRQGRPTRLEWGKANEYYRNLWMLLTIKKAHLFVTGHLQQNYDSEGKALNTYRPHWQKNTKHWLDIVLRIKHNLQKNARPEQEVLMEKCRFRREYDKKLRDNTYNALMEKLEEIGVDITYFTRERK